MGGGILPDPNDILFFAMEPCTMILLSITEYVCISVSCANCSHQPNIGSIEPVNLYRAGRPAKHTLVFDCSPAAECDCNQNYLYKFRSPVPPMRQALKSHFNFAFSLVQFRCK